MKKTISLRHIARLTAIVLTACIISAAAASAPAAEGWRSSFDEICGKVQGADALSTQELSAMIEKADKLMPEIQRSDDPAKKVFLQRLKKCRNMYEFMLETRKNSGK